MVEAALKKAKESGATNDLLSIGLAQETSQYHRGNFTYVASEVVERDERHDLALLRMVPNPFDGEVLGEMPLTGDPVALLFKAAETDSNRTRDGDAIAVSGYPLRIPVLVTTGGLIASSWAFEINWVEFEAAGVTPMPRG